MQCAAESMTFGRILYRRLREELCPPTLANAPGVWLTSPLFVTIALRFPRGCFVPSLRKRTENSAKVEARMRLSSEKISKLSQDRSRSRRTFNLGE